LEYLVGIFNHIYFVNCAIKDNFIQCVISKKKIMALNIKLIEL